MTAENKSSRYGFTLIEVIMVIIVAGILAVVFIPFTSTVLQGSVESVVNIDKQGQLHDVMEKITAHHVRLVLTSKTPLADLESMLKNTPTKFGQFDLAECRYVDFDSSGTMKSSTEKNMLLVTIKVNNLPLTAIFGE